MNRRSFLAAAFGCAVAKPAARPVVVMVPKRYMMTQGLFFDLVVMDDITDLRGAFMDNKTWDVWSSNILRHL